MKQRFIAGFIFFNLVIVSFSYFFYDKSRSLALDARMSMLNAGLDSTLSEIRNIYPSALPKNNDSPRLNNLLRKRAANLGHGLEYLIITRIKGKCRSIVQTKSLAVNMKNGELECMPGMLKAFGAGQSKGNYQAGYRKGVIVHYVSKRFVTSTKQGGTPKSYILWLAKNNVAFEETLTDFKIILDLAVSVLFILSLVLCIGGYVYALRSERIAVKNQAMLDSMPSSNITADEDQNILSDNPAVELMFGWKSGELIKKHLHTIIPERYRDDHDKGYARYYETGESKIIGEGARTTLTALRKDGTEFPCSLLLSKMVINGKVQISAMFVDITPQHEAREKIERKNTALRQFARVARHDLQNAVSPAALAIEYQIEAGYDKDAMEMAHKELQGAMTMFQDLSVWSKSIESDSEDIEREEVDLTNLVNSTIIEGVNIEVCDLGRISCNEGMMMAAIRNIFENSVKYCPTQPHIRVYREDDVMSIRDNAGGYACISGQYDPEYADRLSEPGQRGHTSVEGSGLGIANCRGILQTHGFKLSWDVECGVGTTWNLHF